MGLRQWVFGLVERRRGIAVLVVVDKRDAATLLPIILQYVAPGTRIHSDEWAAYRGLTALGYDHRTVNHSVEFVAADVTHTQTIESTWGKVRARLRVMWGTNLSLLPSHLDEYQFMRLCQRESMDPYDVICSHIPEMYPFPPPVPVFQP